MRKLSYTINEVKKSHIINYRDHTLNTSNYKKTTVNSQLTHLSTFFKFCIQDRIYNYNNPCEDTHFKLTVHEKADRSRDAWTDQDVKKILDNLNLLKYHNRTNQLTKYANEYEMIIKIAMYTGARESEILTLTQEDILIEEESQIQYFRFIVDNEEKSLKNTNSWRFVPVHKDLQEELNNYIKNKKNKLFTISSKQFGKNFSKFKTELQFDSKKVFHSFRNTMTVKLKNQAKNVEVGQEITGHAKNTTFNRYAKGYNLINKKEVLDKIYYNL